MITRSRPLRTPKACSRFRAVFEEFEAGVGDADGVSERLGLFVPPRRRISLSSESRL